MNYQEKETLAKLSRVSYVIEFKGFSMNGKFLLKEAAAVSFENRRIVVATYKVGEISDLDPKIQSCMKWLTRNLHGLEFKDGPRDKPQKAVFSDMLKVWNHGRDAYKKDIIAFRGGVFEKRVLEACRIPWIDLKTIGCPKFVELYDGTLFQYDCNLHFAGRPGASLHCPVQESIYFGRWCTLKIRSLKEKLEPHLCTGKEEKVVEVQRGVKRIRLLEELDR